MAEVVAPPVWRRCLARASARGSEGIVERIARRKKLSGVERAPRSNPSITKGDAGSARG